MTNSFREAELSGWTARADSYDRLFTPISDQAIPSILAVLGNICGKHILDVCCGPGHLTAALAAKGAEAQGLDFAQTMVARASTTYPGIRFRQGDAESLPYGSNLFDHVVCCYGVMHLEQPDSAMGEAHRVLRPGGKYVFTQWAKDDELLKMVASAIAAHGDHSIELPATPPLMRFGDPDECRRTLVLSGFDEVTVDRVELEWRSDRAEALLELIHGSAVRAAMLIDSQAPAHRAKIHEAIIIASGGNIPGNPIVVRRPTLLACGVKAVLDCR
jgi:ubiquinone/menaquinone biosynthesis C-methylase UbiE